MNWKKLLLWDKNLLFSAYASLFFALIFAFITIRESRRLTVREAALVEHRGQVVDIFVEKRKKRNTRIPGFTYKLRLVIDHSVENGLERYRIGDAHRSRIRELHPQIQIRDTVVLFTSPVNHDGKHPTTIWRIDKDGETIFSYAEARRQVVLFVLTGIIVTAVILLLAWWNMKLHRRKKRLEEAA